MYHIGGLCPELNGPCFRERYVVYLPIASDANQRSCRPPVGGQEMPQPTPVPQATPPVLDNATVLKVVKVGLSDDVISAMINGQPGQCSVSPDDLIALDSCSGCKACSPRKPRHQLRLEIRHR